MRRLPHLNGVKAFEAAAEMNVSPAAVSRLVRLLEGRLGVHFFERGANRLALTPQGRMYQVGLSPLLDALAQLTEQVCAQATNRVLTIGVGPTFAVRWLIPRLESFRRTAPDIDVRITTGGAAAPFADDWTSQRTANVGPTPMVSIRLAAWAHTCSVSCASASRSGDKPT